MFQTINRNLLSAGLPSSPPVPDSVFQEMFTQNSSGMAPTAVPDSPQPSGAKEGATPELDMQLGNLSATIQKLHKDAKRFQAEVETFCETF